MRKVRQFIRAILRVRPRCHFRSRGILRRRASFWNSSGGIVARRMLPRGILSPTTGGPMAAKKKSRWQAKESSGYARKKAAKLS